MKSTPIYLALTALVIASLACNLGNTAAATDEPEVVTIVVTATPEPIAEPTATVEPTEEPSATATLNQDLNVRTGPGTAYSIQEPLPGGTTVDVIGQNDAKTWWFISYDGKTGWVSIPYTTYSNTQDVPLVATPALAESSSSSSGGSESGSSSGSSDGDSSSSGSSSDSDSGSGSGSISGAPSDSDIVTSVSIKNGSTNQSGEVSYPDGDTTDSVIVKPTGFDSVTTSGNLTFALTCNGSDAKVKYTGGSITSGSAGCNKTWTAFVTNVSADSRVKIYLESNGYVNWTLLVSGTK